MANLDSILKSRDITLPTKVRLVKAMVFPVAMHECESWAIKKAELFWCFWTMVLEKTLESLLNLKEIKRVNPKGNQSWIFIGRTDTEAETPILWPPDAENWLIRKDPDGWERLKARGVGDDRGWDDWMALPTQWTWVWVNCGSWWRTGRPGMLQSMGLQRVGHDWVTELNWTDGLYSPWNSSGQNTGVGRCSLLQGIFPTQGLNPGLPHCRRILNQLSHHGRPEYSCG